MARPRRIALAASVAALGSLATAGAAFAGISVQGID